MTVRLPEPLPTGLGPVVNALVRDAEDDAARLRSSGRERARATVAAAEQRAAVELAKARDAGARAAATVAAGDRAATRRRARAVVMAARREAVETLRESALSALSAQVGRPGAEDLTRYLASLVEAKTGAPAQVGTSGAGQWEVAASSAAGRAAVDLSMVVDHATSLLADLVEELWQ